MLHLAGCYPLQGSATSALQLRNNNMTSSSLGGWEGHNKITFALSSSSCTRPRMSYVTTHSLFMGAPMCSRHSCHVIQYPGAYFLSNSYCQTTGNYISRNMHLACITLSMHKYCHYITLNLRSSLLCTAPGTLLLPNTSVTKGGVSKIQHHNSRLLETDMSASWLSLT